MLFYFKNESSLLHLAFDIYETLKSLWMNQIWVTSDNNYEDQSSNW